MGSVTILGTPTWPTANPAADAVRVWSLASQHGPVSFFAPGTSTAGFVIPAGVSLVEVFVNIRVSFSSTVADARIIIRRNGVSVAEQLCDDQSTATSWAFSTGALSVSAGDIIDLTYASFGTGTQALVEGFFAMAEIDRMHVVAGRLSVDTAITSTVIRIPLTIEVDTADSWLGLSDFLVPDGADVAIVSIGLVPSVATSGTITYQLLRNGIVVRQFQFRNQNWLPGPTCFGPVAVQSRDVLSVRVSRSGTSHSAIAARGNRVSVEYIDAA